MTDANPPVVSSDPIEAVQQWFALMEQCCASVDYDGAECIFADDVVSFGTAMDIVSGAQVSARRAVGKYLGEYQQFQDGLGQCACWWKRQSGVGCRHLDIPRLRWQPRTLLSARAGDCNT